MAFDLTKFANYRYDPFTETEIPKPIGYSGNPPEIRVIPSSANFNSRYVVFLNEIPKDDGTLQILYNGNPMSEVSIASPPSAGEFRVVYPDNSPSSAVGQGMIEFNATDAGKSIEILYYGLGTILQNAMFNRMFEGEYGDPTIPNIDGDLEVSGDLSARSFTGSIDLTGKSMTATNGTMNLNTMYISGDVEINGALIKNGSFTGGVTFNDAVKFTQGLVVNQYYSNAYVQADIFASYITNTYSELEDGDICFVQGVINVLGFYIMYVDGIRKNSSGSITIYGYKFFVAVGSIGYETLTLDSSTTFQINVDLII